MSECAVLHGGVSSMQLDRDAQYWLRSKHLFAQAPRWNGL